MISTFSLAGDRYDDWMAKMDKEDPTEWLEKGRRQGVAMEVLQKIDGQWAQIAYLENAGSNQFRDFLIEVRPGQEKLEIRLRSGYRMWDVNYVGWSNEVKLIEEVEYIPLTDLKDQDGIPVSEELQMNDDSYVTLPEKGDHITFRFKAEGQDHFFLIGQGYYHHILEMDHSPYRAGIKEIRKERGLHQLSYELEYWMRMAPYLAE